MKTVIAALALSLAVFVAAFAADPMVPAGTYTVVGKTLNGEPYEGFLVIQGTGPVYELRWELKDGISAQGFAVHDGDVLSMICSDGNAFCYGHYRWRDGKWVGIWGQPTAPVTGRETLTPTKKDVEQLRRELNEAKVTL